jgi:hypothetical protein
MADQSSNQGSKPVAAMAVYISSINAATMLWLVAYNLVSFWDILFVVFTSFYVCVMPKVAFPTPTEKVAFGSWRFPGGKYLTHYMLGSALISLLIPLVQIIVSSLTNDKVTVLEAAPHLFLVSAQVVTEFLVSRPAWISTPVKAMVPVMYNSWRLLTVHTWVTAVFSRDLSSSISLASTLWSVFWRSVVVGNFLFWNYNLWAFLLPVYVPWSLRKYYTEMNAKGKL